MFADLLTRVQDFFVWDVMWVSGVVLGMVLFSYTLGRYAMVPLFAALVTAGVLSTHAAYVDHIPFLATLAEHEERVIMFFVVALVAFVVFRKNSFFEPCIVPSGWELVIFAIIYSGFTLAMLGAMLSPEMVETVSMNVRIVFVDEFPRTLWLVSPLLLFSVLRGSVD